MQLSEKHIDFIENSLKLYGVKSKALQEDLVDHISTYIENQDSNDFNELYQEALQKFGGYASFQNLQLETNRQKFAKERVVLNRLKISLGLAMVLLLVLGMLFKIMHWPYASALLTLAILIFAFLLVPVIFYAGYKTSIHKFS
ncbi:hypothetical protein [Winogradskyella sp. UBA3174]|uniref:hypothetical protein n=1 Tax=Winogradskyella sp. UBA3174 TaxID=1947785 RepID=UPI0025E65E70|nr:hypothetical protein [Winogradskyella sp. UBA3174]|tara:strand:+ start:3741 stop:4169 length:429 start_codon:yes stop_codon:yes gene_type:complete